MRKRNHFRPIRKLIFELSWAVLFFVVLEFGFRAVIALTSDRLVVMIDDYKQRNFKKINQELLYRPHPYFGYVRRDRGLNDDINSLGFWGAEIDREKPTDTVRIVALGGSTTAGSTTSWPHQLEVILNSRLNGKNVEVQNLGMGGWTSAEAVTAFAMVGLSFNPDVVVVHCANNDMEPMRAHEPIVDYSHYRRAMNVVQTETGDAILKHSWADEIDAAVSHWSDLYVYVKLFLADGMPRRTSLHELTTWRPATKAEPSEEGIAIFERNLRSIGALAEANDALMILTTMPALRQDRPDIPTVPDGHLRSLEYQNNRIRRLAEKEGWLLVDLALLSEELSPYFEDAIHLDARGDRLKAQALADRLMKSQLLTSIDVAPTKPAEGPQ
jgi:hypothetical protein